MGDRGKKNVADERFAHIPTDPRFRTVKRTNQRVKADARWRSMIKDERFTLKASAVDKRGRPKHTSLKEDLLRVYDISDSSDGEAAETSESESDQNASSDVVLSDNKKSIKSKAETDLLPDLARGEGLVDSSSDDEDEEDEDTSSAVKDSQEIEHAWGELDKDADRTTTVTSRLAVCNMDWDRIRAVDLLVLFNSFKPERGVIQSVSIYPSEYGLKKMSEENACGPSELKDMRLDDDAESSNDENDDDNDIGKDYHREKLRQYQLNRLKFYYAVVVCDSPQTANQIYESCDGIEYECSANKLDLRFVPDDMTFDQEPKSTATSLPDVTKYEPTVFTNSALQNSSVTLTWDETPLERKTFMERNFSKDDLADQDLRDYIASDTDSDADPYGELIDDSEWRQNGVTGSDSEVDDANKIEKFKQLVRSLKDDKAHKDDKDVELEVTWEPGLKEKTEKKIKEQEQLSKKLTPWEEFKQKKKKKRLEKKEAKLKKKQGSEYSDDDIPDDVDLSDPYFAEELSKTADKESKSTKKKNKKMKKKWKTDEDQDEDSKQRQAELALLVMDDDGSKKHFDLSERKKKKGKRKRSEKTDSEKTEAVVDVNDPRFGAIYSNPLYNVDPSAPEFKRSRTMEAILEEKVKRRTKDLNRV